MPPGEVREPWAQIRIPLDGSEVEALTAPFGISAPGGGRILDHLTAFTAISSRDGDGLLLAPSFSCSRSWHCVLCLPLMGEFRSSFNLLMKIVFSSFPFALTEGIPFEVIHSSEVEGV